MTADPRARRAEALLLFALLLAFAAALSLQDIRSFDYWWLLATGRLIAETGAVPKADPYTFTAPGARWVDIHWLHQLGLYELFSLGGHAAVVAAKLVLVLAWVGLLAPIGRRRARPAVSVAALGLMLVVSANRIMPRPELPTFALLAAVLLLLDRFERTGGRAVYGIVAIQLVWVNLHGLFAIGIALCAIHLAGECARPLGGNAVRWDRVRRLASVVALSIVASLANPHGLDGALYPLAQLDMVGSAERRGWFGVMVSELRPPIGTLKPFALTAFLLLAGLSLASIALNRRRVREADALSWVAFFYLAIGAQRNVALFATVAAPLLVRNLNDWLDGRARSPRAEALAVVATALALLALLVDVGRNRFFVRVGTWRTPGMGVVEGFNPIGAAEWIARERPEAPVAHTMSDGGYLIWRLWPAYEVMVDGRLEVYGTEAFERLHFTDPDSFERLDAEYHFGTVLLSYRRVDFDSLLHHLDTSPTWRLAYLDDVSAVFVREPSRFAAVDLDAGDLFPPAEASGSVHLDMERLRARARVLAALRRYDLALSIWEEALARYPDIPEGGTIERILRERAAQP
jgi:hypothetical protein